MMMRKMSDMKMKYWNAPVYTFHHGFDQVASIFYDRYPNSYAVHVISEDVIERRITENYVYTKKLIVKKGSSFIQKMPGWLWRAVPARFGDALKMETVPTLEESIYDRQNKTLTTYTRNVSCTNLFFMDERCRYFPAKDPTKTESIRELKLGVMGFNGAFTYTVEKVLAMAFKKSVHKTYMGFEEKLGQRFGLPPHHTLSEK
uniref:PRELI/MSF1 domain-containing protein n=1 Tax=Acrobeloides nanus TaxID=290746 RepID=A0A914CZL2_9BILA